MVKTRGLGRALGRVVARGLARGGDGDDTNDAPKRRRPTASARRRRVPVIIDDVVPVVPVDSPAVLEAKVAVVGDEPMVDAATSVEIDAQDTGAQGIGDKPEGFPGEPRDPSVLTEYADHVAANVWFGQERPELKLSSHGRKVHHLGMPVPAIEDMVAGTGLSPLIACSIDTGNQGLISSFVERWHRETSSFHLPVGEISITLDDITTLLHLPIVGALHDFQPLCTDEAVLLLVELLMVSPEVAMVEKGQCGGPYVCLQWLRDMYQPRCQTQHWTAAARAYLLHLLGCTLYANKSATHVHVVHLQALRDLTLAGRYTWGAAGLVHMYDQLNDASHSTSRQLAGYMTLLQCWIYEHLPLVVECNADPNYDEVRWGPVVVRYRPERVVRQFGYVQCIPAHPVHPWVSVRQTTLTGSSVFLIHSWPMAQPSDPPTDAPQVPKSDIPQVSDDPARSDVDEPIHAVEACDAIAERLERHLSLGVVTSGTSTHEVIEECLKIVRSVTQDRIVYVKSRHRRHMDPP
ncbi:Protein MAIN-LIKE 1 [Glycine soja]